MQAAVSSSALACCSVRADTWLLLLDISALALSTASELARTWLTTLCRLVCMKPSWAIRLTESPPVSAMGTCKSPAATLPTRSTAMLGSAPSCLMTPRTSQRLPTMPSAAMTSITAILSVLLRCARTLALAACATASFEIRAWMLRSSLLTSRSAPLAALSPSVGEKSAALKALNALAYLSLAAGRAASICTTMSLAGPAARDAANCWPRVFTSCILARNSFSY